MVHYDKSEMRAIMSANVKRIRKSVGLSQAALAKRAGITHNFINDVENRNKSTSLETIGKLADALEVEPYQFFITPNQWFSSEDRQIIGFLEILNKKVNKIFADSIKVYEGSEVKKRKKKKDSTTSP